jgi:hypothetical protein
MTARKAFKLVGAAMAALLVLGLVAPYIAADQFGQRLQGSLQRALGRRVELKAKVRFSLLHGPAFRVDGGDGSGVVIHEDPSLGVEPVAYVGALEVRPSLWYLLFGKFVWRLSAWKTPISISLSRDPHRNGGAGILHRS